MTDIIGGRIDCMFDQSNTALPQVRGDKVFGLATTSRERLPQMPEVPTLAESGLPGFEATTWYGIYAPEGHAARGDRLGARRSSTRDDGRHRLHRKLVDRATC